MFDLAFINIVTKTVSSPLKFKRVSSILGNARGSSIHYGIANGSNIHYENATGYLLNISNGFNSKVTVACAY